jgi:hypothetical protein
VLAEMQQQRLHELLIEQVTRAVPVAVGRGRIYRTNAAGPAAQNPTARLAVQSNRLQSVPQIFGSARAWRSS